MNMNQKGFANIIIIAVVLLIGLSLAGYFTFVRKAERPQEQLPSQQPQDETAGWKVYTHENISFRYPWDWIVNPEYYSTPGGEPSVIGLVMTPPSAPNAYDAIFADGRQYTCESDSNATRCLYKEGHYFHTPSKNPEVLRIFDLLTKTVVVKRVSVQDETANWKTYQSDKYGFEVKYPPEWTLSPSNPAGGIFQFRDLSLGKVISIVVKDQTEQDFLNTRIEDVHTKIGEILVGGIKANKYSYLTVREFSSLGTDVIVERNSRIFIFTWSDANLFNKFTSTFRFTR